MSESIFKLVDDLPPNNITVKLLNALDFVVPGQWQNLIGFENTIRTVTGETDQAFIQKVDERAIQLYNDSSQGYQRAMWLYQTVDSVDNALANAALANKIGENIGFLSFLSRITPKADTAQTIDLSLKLIVELIAFTQINGIPGDSVSDFVKALSDYSGESLMRMVALMSIDGLIPLGPDFIQKTDTFLGQLNPADLEKNSMFQSIRTYIPGEGSNAQLDFIRQTFGSVSGWMDNFRATHNLNLESVTGSMRRFVEVSDSKLDYLAAFLDKTTNYYEHTGTQTLARRLIERAVSEI